MGAAVLRLAVLPFVGPVREEIGARCAAVGVRPLVADSGAKRAGVVSLVLPLRASAGKDRGCRVGPRCCARGVSCWERWAGVA